MTDFSRVDVARAEAMMRRDFSAMKREYTKMRDVAQKRIKRMGESEFADTKTYEENKEGFRKIKDIDPRDFAKAFSELSKFVAKKTSTVTGQKERREKTIKAWNDQNIKLNKENYSRTMKIMEEMRKRKIIYDSEIARNVADMTLAVSNEQFEKILDNLEAFLVHSDAIPDFLQDKLDEMPDNDRDVENIDMSDFAEYVGWNPKTD